MAREAIEWKRRRIGQTASLFPLRLCGVNSTVFGKHQLDANMRCYGLMNPSTHDRANIVIFKDLQQSDTVRLTPH